jgi:hypothetical protein
LPRKLFETQILGTFWNSDSWHFLILSFETQHLSSSHWYFSNSALFFSTVV